MEDNRAEIIRGLRQDIDVLYQAPALIRQVQRVCDILPHKSSARKKLITQVRQLRKQLINLDVVCQDIEWSVSDRNLRQQEEFQKQFSNTFTANT